MCAKWIEPKEEALKSNMYLFSKTFIRTSEALVLKTCASSRYKLYINGRYIAEGPCQGTPDCRYYEETDVTEYLRDGENLIEVIVLHVHEKNADFSPIMTTHRPTLWAEGVSGGEAVLETDESWKIFLTEGIELFAGDGVMFSAGLYEKHIMPYKQIPLTTNEANEAYRERNSSNPWGLINEICLEKRTLPQMKTYPPKKLRKIKQVENELHFGAEEYTSAKVRVRACGKKGDTLKITYSECYVQSADGWKAKKGKRDDTSGILTGPSDYIVLTGEEQEVEFFWYRAFRYISASCKCPEELSIEIEYMPYFYPFDISGTFNCSNEVYNKMWDVSINTLRCCCHETAVDCPHYEQQQYDMDSYLESMFMLQISDDTRLVEKIIKDLAYSQRANGLLCANFPARYAQIIPGFSFYWIMLLQYYYEYSGNVNFIKPYMGTLDKILCYFENNLTPEGLVSSNYWPYLDWAENWENGVPQNGYSEPICVYSMLYSYGLKCADELAVAAGRDGLASEYRQRRIEMNKRIKEYFWDGEYYNDALNTTEKSRHTAIWAILTELETGDGAKRLAEKMMSDNVTDCSFSMGFFLFRALEKTGMYDEAFSLFGGFEKMLDLNCTTWCEEPDNPRSECHAWSSVPLYEFHRCILGVKPCEIGYTAVEISPKLGNLEFAEGTVPTPHGDIWVRAERRRDKRFVQSTGKAYRCGEKSMSRNFEKVS